MSFRIQNLDKWKSLKKGSSLEFKGAPDPARRVRLELNSDDVVRVDVTQSDGKHPENVFLLNVNGHEIIEFIAAGTIVLHFGGKGQVWYYTPEGDTTEIPASKDAKSFTRLMNRRARNVELERMMWTASQNIERRIAALTAEYEARLNALSSEEYDEETGEQGRREIGARAASRGSGERDEESQRDLEFETAGAPDADEEAER